MSTELIVTTAHATTAVRNVYEIIAELVRLRKRNQQITLSKIRLLRESSDRAIALARMAGIQELVTKARNNMTKSLEQVEKFRNTALGDLFLESLRFEWDSYGVICKQYLQRTGGTV